ncbi:hypothetical protein LEP1GSC016_2725 [Leptospira borgpetersenii serovar Hardjo-bovis str. Sponselee]|uniref:Uncharacterized protein n=7 Tax=Leptospira borgpetersenii TaxID=174 RepID=M3HLT5_LEPBO|nr:hypothetical protein LBBP_03841 [Leptospira borgpetersenii serovar Ballum]ANH02178.2 Uncharacterized protein LB4E_3015 [Leptospira borgpetersenii str. 4E]EKP13419.1 hypothetical protein LEP1GSC128_3819 [Leptospira borgpetersenii str. 200801926]EKQ93688.1 hypothetical protein LEP1GSC101_1840 [Leptospira borgpetersenii str. UI 09149]EKR00839.1 hypothetical protein LEP1GSC121_0097 [Leptospira borgpetersenii serovar Castellonis str. 200801910]EMF98609.1 hypothetical protein LEP1GSC123_1873 [Lep
MIQILRSWIDFVAENLSLERVVEFFHLKSFLKNLKIILIV